MTQFKAVTMFGFTSSFNIYKSKQHLQLALPKQLSNTIQKCKISDNRDVSLINGISLLTGIKNCITACFSLLNNNNFESCGYLLLNYATMSIIPGKGFLYNHSEFYELQKRIKVFYFN